MLFARVQCDLMMTDPHQFVLPDLPVLRARVTLRLLEHAALPAFKGGMLRDGFGYAFQRASCPPACWSRSDACTIRPLCPYRSVFEPPHPPDVAQLHDLRDVPRPFMIEPPLDARMQYAAGDRLEFGLVLIGRGSIRCHHSFSASSSLAGWGWGDTMPRRGWSAWRRCISGSRLVT